MTWLVFGVSCLLVLAGAVAIISGAPIIQLERGWAEVISGTVALSSGGVVFALAAILMRLESIRDTLAARAVPLVPERFPAPPPAPITGKSEKLAPVPAEAATRATEPPLARATAAPEIDTVVIPVPADADTGEGIWKRLPPLDGKETVMEGVRRPDTPERAVPDEPEAAAPIEAPPHVVTAPAAVDVPPSDTTAPAHETMPMAREAGQMGWLERSLFKSRPPRAAPDPAPDRPASNLDTPGPERRDEPAEPALAAFEPPPLAAARSLSAADELTPTPDLASDQHQGVTVIGRYQAGVASYIMYSDGTIEVETEGGEMHRFGSMEELKAYIAQQDTAVP